MTKEEMAAEIEEYKSVVAEYQGMVDDLDKHNAELQSVIDGISNLLP